ncbi:MAG: RNA-guided pseudouridylation complex pseudouridine synthase subunit Cbf5 [Candidatus Micrarchaeota archaeon]|nr:RNA-guided pseudouridylation complex pseudouridine synthase subunit Cbf5 [Candidatus Micrarchaeota archaeon]
MAEIAKIEAETDASYGRRPEERSMEELMQTGIVLVDKPCGPSSHEVSAWVRRMLGAERSGHSGTLDPNVSGLLPVGINRSTRVMPFITKKTKEYVGIMRLHQPVSGEKLADAFAHFTGGIEQLPPRRSAVKRQVRKRKVYYLDTLESNALCVLFRVGCEAGTYIRKLCFDMGQYMGCGANMEELRRTKVGNLGEESASKLQDLSDAFWAFGNGDETRLRQIVRPIESVLEFPRIWVSDSTVDSICSGAQLAIPGIVRFDEEVRAGSDVGIMSLKDELVAIASALMDGRELSEKNRGIATKTIRVVMKKGTYPRCW